MSPRACFVVFVLLVPVIYAQAQSAVQPGQLASASFERPMPLLAEASAMEPVQKSGAAFAPERPSRTSNRLWLGSMALLIGATSTDAATSWGHQEANGLLASANGSFGMKGVSLKFAGVAATLIPQIAFRHHAKLLKAFTLGNAAEAGIYAGAAVHNIGVTSK